VHEVDLLGVANWPAQIRSPRFPVFIVRPPPPSRQFADAARPSPGIEANSADRLQRWNWRGCGLPERGLKERGPGLGSAWSGGQGGFGPGLARCSFPLIGPLRMARYDSALPRHRNVQIRRSPAGGGDRCQRLRCLQTPAPSSGSIPTWRSPFSAVSAARQTLELNSHLSCASGEPAGVSPHPRCRSAAAADFVRAQPAGGFGLSTSCPGLRSGGSGWSIILPPHSAKTVPWR